MDRVKQQRKAQAEEARYGLTFGQAVQRFGTNCAICGKEVARSRVLLGKEARLKGCAIDHCHSTGIVRGLLCMDCNMGLGWFKDRIELLHSAAAYLKRYEIFK